MNKIPLVMKVWAGAEPHDMHYITRSIPSLLASRLPASLEIVIYDDYSPNVALREFLAQMSKHDTRIRVIHGTENKGPNLGQQDIYRQVVEEYPSAPHYLNVDDDVVYHRDWLTHLLAAHEACQSVGLNGVFTALNMPYRNPHSVLTMHGRKYLLKWKQPALNWLIPRNLYEDVGPFRDEGIAYDTVYSHWMRLKNYSVICMTPSYVQNIGLLGAYATDDTTTSRDFVGEGEGYPLVARLNHALRYTLRRLPENARRLLDNTATQVAPVRWGTEFVHEGIDQAGESVAMFSFDDGMRLGWPKEEAARRVIEVQHADRGGTSGIVTLRKNRQGTPVWVECRWRFAPNLRELPTLKLAAPSAPDALFRELIRQLLPLHEKGIAHNKIRQDNIYRADKDEGHRLTWLGTEPYPGTDFIGQGRARTIEMLSGAFNRWVLATTREEFAARYLESMAPEVMRGNPATPASDLFSVAAVIALTFIEPIRTMDQLEQLHQRWAQGDFAELPRIADVAVQSVIRQCLASDPKARPADAREAAKFLEL